MMWSNLPYRDDQEVIVKEEGEGLYLFTDTQRSYCDRVEMACTEYINFKSDFRTALLKRLEEQGSKKNPMINSASFYDDNYSFVLKIVSKYNIKQKSIRKICRS